MRIRPPKATWSKHVGVRIKGSATLGPLGGFISLPIGKKTTKTGRKREVNYGGWFRI